MSIINLRVRIVITASLKIVQVCGSFPPMPCGVGDNTYALVEHLAKLGHHIDVITSRKASEESPHENVRIHPIMPGWSYFYAARLLKTVRKLDPDIVHIQYPTKGYGRGFAPSILGMQLKAKKSQAPYVVTLHEFGQAHPFRKAAIMPLLTEASVIIFPAEQERDALHFRFDSLRRIPTRLIPIGAVLPSNYEALKANLDSSYERLKEKWKIPKDGIIVNYGFLQRHKGFEILLAAFQKIIESKYDCELWHVGGFNPLKNPYDRFIQFLVKEMHLEDRVKFQGFLPLEQASEIFSIARVGVFPFTDGYSDRRSSMITFAHFDAPMITTFSTSIEVNDRIKNFVTLVDPDDDLVLAQKMEEIIGNDVVYRNTKENAEGFKKLYDWDMLAKRVEGVYVEFLEQRPIGIPPEQVKLDLEVDSLSENFEKLEKKREEKK